MELLRSKEVKTLKPHRCFGCSREFPKGTKMKFEVWVDEGSAYNSYLCKTCQEVESELANEFGGWIEYGEGDLREEAIEYEKAQVEKDLKG